MIAAGRCLCGAVSVRIEGEPLTARECWCRDCQYLAAGGATHNVFLRSEQLSWDGEVRWYESVADSGNMLRRGFCPACGTPLFTQSLARTHLIAVRMGALDDTNLRPPELAIWTDSAPAWAHLDPALPTTGRQPPPAA